MREKMLADAVLVAPPTLARIMLQHPDDLLRGMADPTRSEGGAGHREDGDEAAGGGAAFVFRAAAARAIGAIDDHQPMSDVAYHLGVLAHVAADLNDPLLTSADGGAAPFAGDFSKYVERNVRRFPVVFYGYSGLAPAEGVTPAGARNGILTDALSSASRAREYFPHLDQAYASGRTSASFDVRSIPFGVASICYSRAVTGIARAWLQVWVSARGDLTGTPFLAGAPPAPARREMASSAAPVKPPVAPAAPPALTAQQPPVAEGDRTGDETVEAVSPAADPTPPPITKTILGKSRKRLRNAAADPNARPDGDPDIRETTDGP